MTKLSLSEVAAQAGVSRPTLYRWFASKDELLDAFVVWERKHYDRAVAGVPADLNADERLDATLQIIVDYQRSYPGLRMVDIEPAHVIARLSPVHPADAGSGLERLTPGSDAEVAPRGRRPSGWPSLTIWCAAMTMRTFCDSFGTRRTSSTTRREAPRDDPGPRGGSHTRVVQRDPRRDRAAAARRSDATRRPQAPNGVLIGSTPRPARHKHHQHRRRSRKLGVGLRAPQSRMPPRYSLAAY